MTSSVAIGSALRVPAQFVASQYCRSGVAGGRGHDGLVLTDLLRAASDCQFVEAAVSALWWPDDQSRVRADIRSRATNELAFLV